MIHRERRAEKSMIIGLTPTTANLSNQRAAKGERKRKRILMMPQVVTQDAAGAQVT